jgi:sugar O-acyltransferase (sialic acid O-acetyltransferase NeuD family)
VKTVIYGSRSDGQANVVAQLAAASATLELVGLIDDFPENRDRRVGDLRVIGTGDDLATLRADGIEALLIGFGESAGRSAIVRRATAAGFELPQILHQSAVVFASARLAPGAQIFPLALVGASASIGEGALVNTAAVVEHDGVLEPGAVVLPGAKLGGRVRVCEDATVGAGAVVLPDVEIGAGALVGAGAVVLRSVAAGQRVVGVPARPLD